MLVQLPRFSLLSFPVSPGFAGITFGPAISGGRPNGGVMIHTAHGMMVASPVAGWVVRSHRILDESGLDTTIPGAGSTDDDGNYITIVDGQGYFHHFAHLATPSPMEAGLQTAEADEQQLRAKWRYFVDRIGATLDPKTTHSRLSETLRPFEAAEHSPELTVNAASLGQELIRMCSIVDPKSDLNDYRMFEHDIEEFRQISEAIERHANYRIGPGEIIGQVGSTGRPDEPCLRYEVWGPADLDDASFRARRFIVRYPPLDPYAELARLAHLLHGSESERHWRIPALGEPSQS